MGSSSPYHRRLDPIQSRLPPVSPTASNLGIPEIVLVRGWKGSDGGLYEPKQLLNGLPSLPCLTDVAGTRTLFAAYHLDLPAGNVTPGQLMNANGESSPPGSLKTLSPHEPTDPFEPNEHDPDDPLRSPSCLISASIYSWPVCSTKLQLPCVHASLLCCMLQTIASS